MSRASLDDQEDRSASDPDTEPLGDMRNKPNPLLPRSIRGTLVLLLLIVLVPTLAIQIAHYYSMFEERRAGEYQANLELARSVAATFDAYVQDILHYESAIGETLASSQPLQIDKANGILLAGARQYPSVRNFDWVDPQGQIIACSGSEMIGMYIGDRPHIQQVIAGREWAISDLMLGKGSGTPTFTVARRIEDKNGILQGIVVAAIDPQRLDEVINVERTGRAAVVVIDSQGWLAYRYPEVQLPWEQRNLIAVQPIIGQSLAGHDVTGLTEAVRDQHKRMSAFTPIGSLGWVASASRPEEEALAPVLVGFLPETGGVLVILVAAFFIALRFSRVITGPIYKLQEHAIAIGRGDANQRVPVSGPDELKGLSQSLNQMANGIRAREEALRETSQTLQTLIEASPLAIVAATLSGKTKMWNRAAERIFGWSEEEVIGRSIPLLPEDKIGEFREIQNRIRQGVTITDLVTRRQKKDGSQIDVNLSTAVMRDGSGNISGTMAVITDITERRLVEDKSLLNSQIQGVLASMLNVSLRDISREEQLQIILDQLVSVPWVQLEAKGCIFLVEDEPETLVMKAQHGLAEPLRTVCGRVPFGQCLCGQAAQSGQTVFADRIDDRHVNRYEGISPHGHYCMPILSSNKVIGVLNVYLKEGYIRDEREEGFLRSVVDVLAGIIERKQAEEELRKSRDDLERRVRERTTELTRVNEELRIEISERKLAEDRLLRAQRLEMAGSVAGQVAHDFNNLLTPFVAYPELIKMELPEGHPAIALCDSMLRAAEQMADINEDLLTLSRRGHFNQEPTDLNRLINQAVSQLPTPAASLVFRLDLAADLFLVRASEAQLLRVISNLLSNAREAMQDEGILNIKTENVYVSKPFGRYNRVEMGEYVRLRIGDTGHGIPEEFRDKIFDPFFTTKHADRRRGSGLGLSVVQVIVEDHGGYVDLDSEEGKGSTFSVYFPIFRGAPNDEPKTDVPAGSETILLVDDDELQREVIHRALATQGYRVNVVSSGEEALAYLAERPVDLLIVDMIIPGGMDGAETYRQVLQFRPDQRAIIISGYAESDRVQEIQAMGAGAYLRKPITLQKLAQAVRGELERKR